MATSTTTSRRRLLRQLAALGGIGLLNTLLPGYARALGALAPPGARTPGDTDMAIAIREQSLAIAEGRARGLTLNGTIPGPVVELYEGREARLRVTNHLDESSSIHWHGILLPFQMDGVPGVAFPGIAPGETFEARFPVRQYGTYWYHSHSGLQEQAGVYGPLIIHPAGPEPFDYDRDYVVMLSDWTFEDPHRVMANLKKQSDYYNFQQQTVVDLLEESRARGFAGSLRERLAWERMRMMPTDIADVTGHTYTYLINGLSAAGNWTGLFRPGERVRLRFINGSSMSYFNIRIPGLPMTVVQADGQNVRPVATDEFQLAVAETLDVIVQPGDDRAYTVMAEAMDRSGYVRGTLAPRPGMEATVPPLRGNPRRTMVDMGMEHGAMAGGEAGDSGAGMDHSGHGVHSGHEGHGAMAMTETSSVVARHGPDRHGPGNAAVAEVQRNRLAEPGTGLDNAGHRVLSYAQLSNVRPMADRREPAKTIELHLTGNMERYMWSFDGVRFQEAGETLHFPYGERIRLVLVNDTMMEHPIHLHGMFFEVENGQGDHLPFKHTISAKPAERLSLLVTASEPGRWAFHCHLLYHMEMGMFRVVEVK